MDTVLGAGSGPVARLAELGVTNFFKQLRHGHLRIKTASHVYSFPAPENEDLNEHPGLHATIVVVRDSFWLRLLTMSDLGFAEAFMYGEARAIHSAVEDSPLTCLLRSTWMTFERSSR